MRLRPRPLHGRPHAALVLISGAVAPSLLAILASLVALAAPVHAAEPNADPAAVEFFEKKVRPILVARCYECHGPKSKGEGGLKFDSREALVRGGDSGPSLVPGDLDASPLISAVRYGELFKMPPKGKLPNEEISALEHWVRIGAPWPGGEETSGPAIRRSAEITAADRDFWSFRPIGKPSTPLVRDSSWPRTREDFFILARLEAAGLAPAPEVDRQTLIRRATMDLWGLLPTVEEVDAFVADESPDAYEKLVDRLLASPAYGERWGRHWLDLARYADSNGMDENLAFVNAFRYRDWVVGALNRDLPFDEFARAQLAGDLLSGDPESAEEIERIAATGLLTVGPKMLAEDDPVKMEMDIIDEQVETVSRAFLGMTFQCARCHDHKYDPFPSDDYYALAGIFKSTKTMENHSVVAVWHERPLATPKQLAKYERAKASRDAVRRELNEQTSQANKAIVAESRRLAGEYLRAALELSVAQRPLEPRMPRDRAAAAPTGAIVFEAEKFSRGNVIVHTTGYGEGIGVILNGGPLPNVAEYDLNVERAGAYQIEIRYAAADPRPVKLSLAGKPVREDALAAATGSWNPDTQRWRAEAIVQLPAGPVTLRLDRDQPFPHIDQLALVPVADSGDGPAGEAPSGELSKSGELDRLRTLTVDQLAEERGLLGAVLVQWRSALELARENQQSPFFAALLTVDRLYPAERRPKSDEGPESNAADSPTRAGMSTPAGRAVLAEPRPATIVALSQRYARLFKEADEAFRKLQATPDGAKATALADERLEPFRELLHSNEGPARLPDKPERFYPAEMAEEIKALSAEATRLDGEIPLLPQAMSVAERAPTDLPIHIRGNHLTLGPVVPRRFPRVIAGEQQPPLPSSASGRLELANWIASPENPLTARVIANRLWRWHFGRGLARSVDNFGRLGEPPTHPDLLDAMASDFIADGWSLKRLHRRLMLSATYRQSARPAEATLSADPENRLWGRRERRRVEAEALRDTMLQVSGQLDQEFGGSLLRSKAREYVAATNSVNRANYDTRRRSIYLPVVRSALFDLYQTFDFADPSTGNGDRDQTTVAPQALFMLNSPLAAESSRALAQRLFEQAAPSGGPTADGAGGKANKNATNENATNDDARIADGARVRRAWLICFARPPADAELTRALAFLDQYTTAAIQTGATQTGAAKTSGAPAPRRLAWEALCRALLSASEFTSIE